MTRLRRCQWLAFVALVYSADIVLSTPSFAAPRLPTLEDLEPVFGTVSLSSDESAIAISDSREVLVLSFPDGRLIRNLGPGMLPQWAPTAKRLAFYSRRSGEPQLWIWEFGGEPWQATAFAGGVDPDISSRFADSSFAPLEVAWSYNSRKIALASRVPVARHSRATDAPLVLTTSTAPELTTSSMCALPAGCANTTRFSGTLADVDIVVDPQTPLLSQLFVIDLETKAAVQLTSPNRVYYRPIWSEDGSKIYSFAMDSNPVTADLGKVAESSATPGSGVQLLAVSTHSKTARVLADGVGLATSLQRWGSSLFYKAAGVTIDRNVIHEVDANTGERGTLAVTVPVQRFYVQPNGALSIEYSDGLQTAVGELSSGRDALTSVRHIDSNALDWVEDRSGGLVWIRNEDGTLRYWPREARAPKNIFSFGGKDGLLLGREERIAWTNGRGDRLTGWLLYPSNYIAGRRYPLIVDAYPLSSSHSWMHPMGSNYTWAAAGYAVFKPGPRGPHVWMNADDSKFGDAGKGSQGWAVALDDVTSGIDALAKRGLIDPDRMCLYGHSSGGAEVAYLITMTHRFKCAVMAAPGVVNWLAGVEVTGIRNVIRGLSGGLDFDRDASELVRMSAVFNLYKARTPVLIACGDDDSFLSNAIQVYNALRDAGQPVTLVRYPGQGHVLEGAAMKDFWRRQMAFFAEHIGDSQMSPPYRTRITNRSPSSFTSRSGSSLKE